MIAVGTWPLSERQYAALKLAGRIRHMPSESEIAADTERAVERSRSDRERAVKQADAILAAARRGDNR